MIKYIKNELKHLPMTILVFILLYGVVTIATSNINSNDITFDNTNSNLNAGDMQEAIDEVFQHATDYNEIKTTIGDSTLTTTDKTLTGGINELNNKLIVSNVASNITGTTGISFDYKSVLKIGRIVVVNIRFSVSTQKTGNSTIMQGFPSPTQTTKFAVHKSNGGGIAAVISAGSSNLNNDWGTLTTGDWFANFVYFTN